VTLLSAIREVVMLAAAILAVVTLLPAILAVVTELVASLPALMPRSFTIIAPLESWVVESSTAPDANVALSTSALRLVDVT